jgi:very-short-patch-repair endonuclease
VRAALERLRNTGPQHTRSKLEERFLENVVAAYHLLDPRVNTCIARHEVDFLWPDQRLFVETDGRETHGTVTAFQDDRRRDADLLLAG